jgi:hypothetical protein
VEYETKMQNPLVKQFDVGKEVVYFHIECKDYVHDNIILEGGTIVESYGSVKSIGQSFYTWNDAIYGFKREIHDNTVKVVRPLLSIDHFIP